MAKEVEPEEVIRLIDSVYKSIIDKFNPCARQLITAGKAYLKALQGANSASNVFIETLNKIAVNAQQGTSSDIGDALLNVVNVHKAIQEQHVNILKAFYVDLLMPLETNLEKDTKVVQVEQKKFLQQHKANVESYCKAVTTLKKQRKKKSASGTTSKELKSLQAVEEQKNKLRVYCNQSLKNALTQERRRYGFVLERQCSIAKHWMSYYNTGKTLLDNNLDDWLQIAATRENVNLNLHDLFSKNKDGNKSDLESNSLLLRKTRSMEVAGGPDNKRDDRGFNQNSLPRTKSEHNLTMSTSAHQNHRFSNVTSEELVEELLIMKAVYTYQANGKNQLNFEEGDRIALIGGRVNGWQFGENLRTKMMGWFPVTYLEKDNSHHYQQQKQHQHNQYNNQQHHSNLNNSNSNNNMDNDNHHQYRHDQTPISTLKRGINSKSTPEITAEPSPTRMFGDTIQFRNTRYFQKISAADLRTSPPPALPPPIPTESVSSAVTGNHLNTSQSFNFPKESLNAVEKRRPIIYKANKYAGHNNSDIEPPPPQPEIDYSDEEEIVPTRVPLRQHHRNNDNNRDDNMKRPLSSMTYDERVSSSSTRNSSASPKSQHHHLMSNNLADIDLNTLTRKDNFIKRTKSFWKNKKQDEIHHQINNGGMSWRHEDIIMNQKNNNNNIEYKNQEQFLKSDNNSDSSYQMDGTMDRRTRSTHNQQNNENSNNSPKPQQKYLKSQPKLSSSKLNHHHQQQDKSKLQEMNISVNNNNNNRNKHTNKTKIESKTITSMNFDNKSNNNFHQKSSHRHHHNNFDSDDSDNSTIKISEINNNQNFDDISTISLIKKPFKRREILKQYYNNTNTDEEDEEDLDFDDRNVDHHHHRHHLHHHHNHQSINNKNIHNHDDNHHPNDDHNHNHDHGDDDDDDDDNERDDYSDGSDTERENDTTISDPYDCIVIDDHLVKSKMEFKTFKGETNNNNQQTQVQSSPKHQIQNKIKNDQNEHNNNINNNKNININNKNKNSALNSASNTTATTTTSGTLLPRTKLNKSTNNSKENHLNNNNNIRTSTSNPIQSSSSLLLTDNNNKMMSNNNNNEDNNNSYINSSSNNNNNKNHQQDYSDDSYSKSYGPWYDLWEDNNNNNKQSLHNITKS